MSRSTDCCEPSGEMVAALRETFELGGRPVGAGIARAALMAALMVDHEHRDQAEPTWVIQVCPRCGHTVFDEDHVRDEHDETLGGPCERCLYEPDVDGEVYKVRCDVVTVAAVRR